MAQTGPGRPVPGDYPARTLTPGSGAPRQAAAAYLPRNVWWAVWDGVAGPVIDQQSVALDSQYSAQRFLRSIENTVVGFHWEW